MAGVYLVRTVKAQRRGHCRNALLADVNSGLHIARDRKAEQVCHGAATGQGATGSGRKPNHFPAPVDHLSFNENGGVIAASQVRSLNCCKKICQGACKVAGPHVPGPETWMHIAHWIGHGVLRNEAEDLGQRLRSSWQWLGKSLSHDSRHVAPGWLRAHVPKIGNCLINDPMRRFCYREPVGRVERLFGGNFDVCAHSFHGGTFQCRQAANWKPGVESDSASSSLSMSASMPSKSGVDRYRSPVSGSMHSMTDPAGACSATWRATPKVAPAEIPQKMPSFWASSLAHFIASGPAIGITSS